MIEAIQRKALTQRGVSLDTFLSTSNTPLPHWLEAPLVSKLEAPRALLELNAIPATVTLLFLGQKEISVTEAGHTGYQSVTQLYELRHPIFAKVDHKTVERTQALL